MIPKGNQRAGGRQLATHLMNEYDNDSVEIIDIHGAVASDLHGAFAEWEAQSRATKCRKYLYSLSINPDHRQQDVKREHYFDFIARTERSLGLTGQPRAIVMHVKHGREHCHVVWSRIDVEKARAVQISHDRQKLRTLTQEYARDRGLELPEGAKRNCGKARFEEKRKREDLAEKGQEKRTGISKDERRDAIAAAWRESDSGKAFCEALASRGYHLARGDKRSYVVVDQYGEAHSLSRQIQGVKAATLRERLSDIGIDRLQDVETARSLQAQERRADTRQQQSAQVKATEAEENRRRAFADRQAERRAGFEKAREELRLRHDDERVELADLQSAEKNGTSAEWARRSAGRIGAFLQRITGIQRIKAAYQRRDDAVREALHEHQRAALRFRHAHERLENERQWRALSAVELRERASFETDERRGSLMPMPTADRDKERLGADQAFNIVAAQQPSKTASHESAFAGARSDKAPAVPGKRIHPEQKPGLAAASNTTPAAPVKSGRLTAFFDGLSKSFTVMASRFNRASTTPTKGAIHAEPKTQIPNLPFSEPASLKNAYAQRSREKAGRQEPSRGAENTRGHDLSP